MEPLPRPAVPETVAERTRAWILWFGVGRLVASAVAVLVVGAGAFWLVRAPSPPTESLLPMATSPSTSIGATAGVQGPTTVATTLPEVTVVHVAGAVARPGVYELVGRPRVADAVAIAGGATAEADGDAVNLAAPVPDGSRVYLPSIGETAAPELITAPPAVGTAFDSGPVDVNRAAVDELDSLPGVGPATATAIVTERERNGPFLTVDDLVRVPGIGPAKLDALRDLVST